LKAVILAAGSGSRFKQEGISTPKPLIQLGGLSLLERAARSCAKAGISEILVVTGAEQEAIHRALKNRLLDLPVRWIENPHWQQGNGTSVLAAAPWLHEPHFLVIMADHLLFPVTLKRLIEAPLAPRENRMAIDRKRGLVSDPEDATKVRLEGDRIIAVNKQLENHDGLDVGAAVCSHVFLTTLMRRAQENGGDCSHTHGMQTLASQDLLFMHDIGPDRWEDVDSSESFKAAERILFDSLRKPTDGFMSRHVERHLSLAVTRQILKTGITPNQMTLMVMMLGGVAAFFFAQPGYVPKVAGALLFWCASFLDGCDGELARLKFLESRLGGWLDLWGDNVVHCLVFLGIGIGLWRDTGNTLWGTLGLVAALGVLCSVSWVSGMTIRGSRKTGTLYTSVAEEAGRGPRPAWLSRLITLADTMSRRDFIFGVIFLTILGWLPAFLWAAAIGSNLFFLVLVVIHLALRKL